ncbi:MAG: tol-pal system protein YbgF [Acidobacteriota bacterium]
MVRRRKLSLPFIPLLLAALSLFPSGSLMARRKGEDQAERLQAQRLAYARLKEARNRMAERLIQEEHARRRRLGRRPDGPVVEKKGSAASGEKTIDPEAAGRSASAGLEEAADGGLSQVFSMEPGSAAPPRRYPAAVVSPAPESSLPAGPVAPGSAGIELFHSGYSHYSQGDYEAAIADFSAFMDSSPGHPLLDNALYWIGESALEAGDLGRALTAYDAVQTSFPGGDKAADALLKKGDVLLEMGRSQEAHRAWRLLEKQFPGSPAAGRAARRLASARGEKPARPAP